MNRLKELLNSKFVKNVLVLVTGTAAAQIIAIALSPVITRLYGPEAFGIMGTFNAIVNIFIPIAAFTYPIAIVLPKKDDEAKLIIKLSMILAGIFSLIVLIIVFLFNDKLAIILNTEELGGYFYFIPLVILSAAFMQVMEQWLIRKNQFSINAKATFIQSSFVNISKVGIGTFYPYAQILIIFSSISTGIRGIIMYFLSKKSHKVFTISGNLNINLKDVAKKYSDFPFYRAPQDLLFAIQMSFPVVLLSSFFGPASTGFYTVSRTVLGLPTSMLGKAVGDVVYPKISTEANNGNDFSNILKKSTLGLVLLGSLPFGIVILFGPSIFSFVFGENWYTAGEYARWISLWSYSTLINRPSVMTLPVINAQRFHLFYTVVLAIVNFSMIFLGYTIFNSDIISVALFTISGTLANLFLITITIKMSNKYVKNMF